jgi:hypothetical protein
MAHRPITGLEAYERMEEQNVLKRKAQEKATQDERKVCGCVKKQNESSAFLFCCFSNQLPAWKRTLHLQEPNESVQQERSLNRRNDSREDEHS